MTEIPKPSDGDMGHTLARLYATVDGTEPPAFGREIARMLIRRAHHAEALVRDLQEDADLLAALDAKCEDAYDAVGKTLHKATGSRSALCDAVADLPLHLKRIAELEAMRKQEAEDWAEDHTRLQELVRQHVPGAKPEGDSVGAPGITDLAEMLAGRVSELDAQVAGLRQKVHDLTPRFEAGAGWVSDGDAIWSGRWVIEKIKALLALVESAPVHHLYLPLSFTEHISDCPGCAWERQRKEILE